jgi:hypothetical protein
MNARAARYWTRNRIGLALGLGLLLVAAVGEWLGWWHDVGIVLGVVGLILSIWFGIGTATEDTVARLTDDIAEVADRVATSNAILARIEDRLPPRS